MINFITYIVLLIVNSIEKILNVISNLFFGFVLITSFSGAAQIDSKTLEQNLITIQSQSNLPGFAVSIIKNDKIEFSKGFGYADKATKTPFTSETILPIGSVSKTFIGFSIMKAIDLGYFTLETDINSILPFQIINPYQPNEIITIRHLVTHTSSLIDNTKFRIAGYGLEKVPKISLADFLKNYFTKDRKMYEKSNFSKLKVGTNYQYSNIASALAAYIIEVKANMSFADFSKKHIFEPLQMTNSHWFYEDAFANKYATLYQTDKPDYPSDGLLNKDNSLKTYSCSTYPDGSLKTNASDLTNYLIEMQKGYEGKSILLSKNSYETLFKKQFNESNMPKSMDLKEPNRAIFWAYNKKDKLVHTGSDPGVASFVSIDPQTKICKILLLNTALDGQDNDITVSNFKKIIVEIEKFENKLKQ